jgi:hypothetical protein
VLTGTGVITGAAGAGVVCAKAGGGVTFTPLTTHPASVERISVSEMTTAENFLIRNIPPL